MRNPGRVIQATWFAMLAIQTIGSVDAQRKLPAPKNYVAISVLWAGMFLIADSGYGRVAARLSLLILVTASVLGPFGAKLVGFLNMVAARFGISASGIPGGSSGPSTPGGAAPAPNAPPAASLNPYRTA